MPPGPWPELNLDSPHQPSESAYTFLGFEALRHYLRFVCQLQDQEPVRPPRVVELLISPPLREGYRQFCQDFNVLKPAQGRAALRLQRGVDCLLGGERDGELRATFRGRVTPWLRLSRRRRTLKPYFLPPPGPGPELDPSSPI